MTKMMQKGMFVMLLLGGLLFVSSAADAQAQDRCRTRGRSQATNYYNAQDYRDRNVRDRYDDRYYDYDREDTTGKAVTRTGVGAGVGAAAGALIGGKKGALIGAGVGAAGGYLYHRNKVNNQRDRRYRY
ncbi:MAG: hypothetical protein JNJ50_11460 [Acidobacteria bacterium]|nr:hypothetical protein [Acidobacteriota bacterium]